MPDGFTDEQYKALLESLSGQGKTNKKLPGEREIYFYLIGQGVPEAKAIVLASQLKRDTVYKEGMSLTEWDKYVDDYNKYIGQMAKSAASEEQQSREAGYLSLYNPKTGMPWNEEFNPEEKYTGHQLRSGADIDAAEALAGMRESWAKTIKPIQPYTTAAYPWLEQMTIPSMKNYYQRNLASVYAGAGGDQPRQEWKRGQAEFPTTLEAAGAHESPEEYKARTGTLEGYAPSRIGYGGLLARKLATKDPWLNYLQGFPAMEKYKELAPQERGFYSGQYSPMTRWLNY